MNNGMMHSEALEGSLKDFKAPTGKELIDRVRPFFDWQDNRRTSKLWPYAKSTVSAPRRTCAALTDDGKRIAGVNFATQTFSNALSPVQAAVVLEALGIVTSSEGDRRRSQLLTNINTLRDMLRSAGLQPLGAPSPIVPVQIGREDRARLASRHLSELGAMTNLVEYPAVPRGDARFRVQVMADHTEDDIVKLVTLMARALEMTDRDLGIERKPGERRVIENVAERQLELA